MGRHRINCSDSSYLKADIAATAQDDKLSDRASRWSQSATCIPYAYLILSINSLVFRDHLLA